jgi:phage terminase large subunit-like protein
VNAAEQYIRDVQSRKVAVCRWVRLAVKRHLKDLKAGRKRGLYFDEGRANFALEFYGFLRHSTGEWAGQSFELSGWQAFVLWVVFGWRRADGSRRFRRVYLEVARKNGKSTWAAGIGLLLLLADGEQGAQVFSAATKRDQARIVFEEAKRMVASSPALRPYVDRHKDSLSVLETNSFYQPLSSDAKTMDGLNVHGALVDEVHAHRTSDCIDLLNTATGARRQPLIVEITTAGSDRKTICWQHHEHTEKVLNGIIEDDSWFGIIFTVDDGDDWEDERVWVKANPNIGISPKWDTIREEAARAKEIPSAMNAFLRLHLNIWTQAETRWLPRKKWDLCKKLPRLDVAALAGRPCYGGLDLASTTDIGALVWTFPPWGEDPYYRVLCRFFVPKESILQRSRRDGVPYDRWERDGFLTATAGDVIDYDVIRAQVAADADLFDVRELAFDPWNATQISNQLQGDGLPMVAHRQGFVSMSPAMKAAEKLIIGGELAHGDNPVLNWMADNVVSKGDPAGNIKPDKSASVEKIDGVVALIMGVGRAVLHDTGKSVYESRGLA